MSRITYRFCYALFPESGTYPGDAIEGSESTGWSICAAGLIAATMGSTPLSLPNCHFNAAKLDLPLFVIEGEVAHGHLRAFWEMLIARSHPAFKRRGVSRPPAIPINPCPAHELWDKWGWRNVAANRLLRFAKR